MAQPQAVETPFISERLTWEEICERYRYEWVCLVEIDQIDDGFEVNSARVVGRGKTRQEALDHARPFHTQVPTPDHEIAPYFSRPFVPPKRQVAPEWEAPEPVGPPFISEPLTWDEIRDRYPNEWVCLVEIDQINDTDFDFVPPVWWATARRASRRSIKHDPISRNTKASATTTRDVTDFLFPVRRRHEDHALQSQARLDRRPCTCVEPSQPWTIATRSRHWVLGYCGHA